MPELALDLREPDALLERLISPGLPKGVRREAPVGFIISRRRIQDRHDRFVLVI